MRIMIVEDDPLLGEGLLAGLRQAGFSAEWVRDGQAGLDALHAERFSAVVLDIGLPRLSGLELLRQLRRDKEPVPVLILTARDSQQDVISALDGGADDYLVKPCDLGELAARLRALVRRAVGIASSLLEYGTLTLDQAARKVEYQGKPVDLSPREFALLEQLLLNAGRALTRQRLEETLYPWGAEIESNALDVHIHHLRRKLAPELIRTVRGVGYLIPK
jgi:DNA-binding response OmpR family regulator